MSPPLPTVEPAKVGRSHAASRSCIIHKPDSTSAEDVGFKKRDAAAMGQIDAKE